MGSVSFVDINIFVMKYYFIQFLNILHFCRLSLIKIYKMLRPQKGHSEISVPLLLLSISRKYGSYILYIPEMIVVFPGNMVPIFCISRKYLLYFQEIWFLYFVYPGNICCISKKYGSYILYIPEIFVVFLGNMVSLFCISRKYLLYFQEIWWSRTRGSWPPWLSGVASIYRK